MKALELTADLTENASKPTRMTMAAPSDGGTWDGTIGMKDSDGNEFVGATVRFQTLTQMRQKIKLRPGVCYVLDQEGREGEFRITTKNTANWVDDGGVRIRTTDDKWLERVNASPVRPEWFGAKGDFDTATNTGTNDSEAFQRSINYCMLEKGNQLLLGIKTYLVDTDTFIKPSGQIPFEIIGSVGNIREYENNNGRGSSIARRSAGVVFHVNLDENGNAVLPPEQQYQSFAARNISFVRAGSDNGEITAFKTFRTRKVMDNIFGSEFDYIVKEDLTDQAGKANYSDQSKITNIHTIRARTGVLKLNRSDGTTISDISIEFPRPTLKYGIELDYGTTTIISGVVYWSPVNYPVVAGSAIIKLNATTATILIGHHYERVQMESCVHAFYTEGLTVIGNVLRYSANDVYRLDNVKGAYFLSGKIDATINPGYFDLRTIGSYDQIRNVTFQNYTFYAADDTEREMTRTGTLGRQTAPLGKRIVTNLAAMSGTQFFQTTASTLNQPVAGGVGVGYQLAVSEDPGTATIFVSYGDITYTASKVGGVLGSWKLVLDQAAADARYVRSTGAYENPDFVASLDWSKITSVYNVATDAPYTITSAGLNQSHLLPIITANQPLTLPAPVAGKFLILHNRNDNQFRWTASRSMRKAGGTDITTLPNARVIILEGDASGNWRIVSGLDEASTWKYTSLSASTNIQPGSQNEAIETTGSTTITHSLLADNSTIPGTIKLLTNAGTAAVVVGGAISVSINGTNAGITVQPQESLWLVATGVNTWRAVLQTKNSYSKTESDARYLQAQKAAASADAASPVSATYTQTEVQAILNELRDLKAKLRTAGLLTP